jgi:hypothetical protein
VPELDISNAELARMIQALRSELLDAEHKHDTFHNQLLGRLDGQASGLATLQRQVDVERVKYDARITAVVKEVGDHEHWHTEERRATETRRERSVTATIAVSSLVGALGTVCGVAVALLLH